MLSRVELLSALPYCETNYERDLVCAKTSYQQAQEDMLELMGVEVGHSSLHRLVQRTELPLAQSENPGISGVSIDGGKICLRGEEESGGQWRDYKLVSSHNDICEAFFQEPEKLQEWSNSLPLDPIVTLLGDGHPGIWKVVGSFAPQQELIRRQVLDWYHLMENLHKVGGSIKRLKAAENFLWHGFLDAALREFDGLKASESRSFGTISTNTVVVFLTTSAISDWEFPLALGMSNLELSKWELESSYQVLVGIVIMFVAFYVFDAPISIALPF